MSKRGLAIVGIGEVPTLRNPERTRWDILLDVCMQAVRDAGIDKNRIGAVISNNPMAQPAMQNDMSLGKIPEVMGLEGCRDIAICNAGGASTTNCLRLAEQHIESGQVDFVLIPHTTVQSDIPPQDLINFFATAPLDKQFEYPYGVTFNGSMGLITQRYMYETGATEEELAAVTAPPRRSWPPSPWRYAPGAPWTRFPFSSVSPSPSTT
jgi:acetyl-CoA C-acetyltransferase